VNAPESVVIIGPQANHRFSPSPRSLIRAEETVRHHRAPHGAEMPRPPEEGQPKAGNQAVSPPPPTTRGKGAKTEHHRAMAHARRRPAPGWRRSHAHLGHQSHLTRASMTHRRRLEQGHQGRGAIPTEGDQIRKGGI
jgi:hypothetical protein